VALGRTRTRTPRFVLFAFLASCSSATHRLPPPPTPPRLLRPLPPDHDVRSAGRFDTPGLHGQQGRGDPRRAAVHVGRQRRAPLRVQPLPGRAAAVHPVLGDPGHARGDAAVRPERRRRRRAAGPVGSPRLGARRQGRPACFLRAWGASPMHTQLLFTWSGEEGQCSAGGQTPQFSTLAHNQVLA